MARRSGEVELDGTTLRVYLLLLSSGRGMSPREVMRELRLSSPSVAYYHLKKLEELGLVKKFDDGYRVVKKVRLSNIVVIGRRVIPRMLFFASIFIGMLIVELAVLIIRIASREPITTDYLALVGVTLSAALILAIEGIEMHRKLFK